MLIVCKTCASSYHIPPDILAQGGCLLRCVGCGEEWTVTPDTEASVALPALAPERLAPMVWSDPRRGQVRSPRRARVRSRKTRVGARLAGKAAAALAVLVVAGAAMGALAARAAIVKAVPASARLFAAVGLPVNLRGLALDNVRTNTFDLPDGKMLVVEGVVVNLRDSPIAAPDIRIALRGADKRELYVWTSPAPKDRLAASEQVVFRTRLAAPPDGVRDVLVRFAPGPGKAAPMKEGS
jgi:predicted Zn finger-like uncharacterized protein